MKGETDPLDVCLWHLADIEVVQLDVSFGAPFGRPTEDVQTKSRSTFAADEHLLSSRIPIFEVAVRWWDTRAELRPHDPRLTRDTKPPAHCAVILQ